jgi:hypothetical protein
MIMQASLAPALGTLDYNVEMVLRSSVRAAVFLGAGASCCANFPSVDSFFGRVWPRAGGSSHELCSQLARLISVYEQTQENLKWPVFNAGKLFAWLETLERADKILTIDGKPRPIILSDGRGAEMSAVELMSELKRQVVRVYGAELDPHTLTTAPHNALFKLFDTVLPESDPLHVFTTNYDRLLEKLFEHWDNGTRPISRPTLWGTGFSSGRPGQWQPALLHERPATGVRQIKLVKLHGSITWKKDAAGYPVETGYAMPTEHDSLLYFGYKNVPEEEPFLTLHDLLKSTLLQYEVFVVIGFRFGDPYIRELFDLALRANENLRVICCLNHAPESETPAARMMSRFPGRVKMLATETGEAVPFGTPLFQERLEHFLPPGLMWQNS